jgi:hypothetical protein
MKKTKQALLAALSDAAEDAVEEVLAGASGYGTVTEMREELARMLIEHRDVRQAMKEAHDRALELGKRRENPAAGKRGKSKPRAADTRKKSGRVQASRLQPRGHER